jgi:hypothetical protein
VGVSNFPQLRAIKMIVMEDRDTGMAVAEFNDKSKTR